MTERLPSLTALRAFECAARHASISKAARELHVTPAAISHRVKALEDDLGVTLLTRGKQGMVLSESAHLAQPMLSAAFDQIAQCVRVIRETSGQLPLTVSVGPTFASTWLVRRLGQFKQVHPDIPVRLDTTDELADFARDGVDVAIRFGHGPYPGLHSHRLFDEAIYPVCSPSLLERGPPLCHPNDLKKHTLLHVEWTLRQGDTIDWEMWLRAACANEVDSTRGERFSHSNIALQAAIAGQGVVLGSDSLAGDDLADGRLVRPFEISMPVPFAYHFVCPKRLADTPRVVAFRDWLLAEVRRPRA